MDALAAASAYTYILSLTRLLPSSNVENAKLRLLFCIHYFLDLLYSGTMSSTAQPKPFQFFSGTERLDWAVLTAIDISRLVREVNVDTLQRVIDNIAFARLTREEAALFTPDHVVHLFTLSQLVLQYLVYSQDTLSRLNTSLRERLAEVQQSNKRLEDETSTRKEQLAAVKKELKAQKRTLLAFEYSSIQREKQELPVKSANVAAMPIESIQKEIKDHETATRNELTSIKKVLEDFVTQTKVEQQLMRERAVFNAIASRSLEIPIAADTNEAIRMHNREKGGSVVEQQLVEKMEQLVQRLTSAALPLPREDVSTKNPRNTSPTPKNTVLSNCRNHRDKASIEAKHASYVSNHRSENK